MICLLALQKNTLMNQALLSALINTSSDNTVVISVANDLKSLLAEIEELRPNVVLMGEMMPLSVKDSLEHLLRCLPELRVIVVCEDSNWLHVFSKKDVLITRQSDLLDIVYSFNSTQWREV
jgi:chemotaxis response regulator CheB